MFGSSGLARIERRARLGPRRSGHVVDDPLVPSTDVEGVGGLVVGEAALADVGPPGPVTVSTTEPSDGSIAVDPVVAADVHVPEEPAAGVPREVRGPIAAHGVSNSPDPLAGRRELRVDADPPESLRVTVSGSAVAHAPRQRSSPCPTPRGPRPRTRVAAHGRGGMPGAPASPRVRIGARGDRRAARAAPLRRRHRHPAAGSPTSPTENVRSRCPSRLPRRST